MWNAGNKMLQLLAHKVLARVLVHLFVLTEAQQNGIDGHLVHAQERRGHEPGQQQRQQDRCHGR